MDKGVTRKLTWVFWEGFVSFTWKTIVYEFSSNSILNHIPGGAPQNQSKIVHYDIALESVKSNKQAQEMKTPAKLDV